MIECVYGDETIKYFYSDVVIDPSSIEAWEPIGKEVYASLIPARCLMIANGKCKCTYKCFLESIEPKNSLPFYVKVVEADNPGDISINLSPVLFLRRSKQS